jgi:hypothetical protein
MSRSFTEERRQSLENDCLKKQDNHYKKQAIAELVVHRKMDINRMNADVVNLNGQWWVVNEEYCSLLYITL